MIEQIFEWAWRCGLDVQLYSKTMEFPVRTPKETFRIRGNVDFSNINRITGDIPVFRFSRGDKYIEITASNWAEMIARLKYSHEKLFSDLTCAPLHFKEPK